MRRKPRNIQKDPGSIKRKNFTYTYIFHKRHQLQHIERSGMSWYCNQVHQAKPLRNLILNIKDKERLQK
jgi:hypothetical protein